MRICLINPSKNRNIQLCEPLNILLLGTILKMEGHTVRIFDQNAHPEEDIFVEIQKFSPDLVGVTATTTLVNDAYKIGDFCKKNKIRCVIGGPHASALPEEALTHFDLVVVGEGDHALSDIVRNPTKSGIVYGEFVKDLDTLPICDRSLIDMEHYANQAKKYRVFDFLNQKNRLAQIITMRGCPYRCTYCYNSERAYPVRYMSPERVVREIEHLISEYKIGNLFFMDDELFLNKKRAMAICDLIIEKKIKIQWGANARGSTLDYEVLALAKKAGCKFICMGFESGSDKILQSIDKGLTIDKLAQGIKICNQLDIKIEGIFMIGYPHETMDDINKTEDFIMKHKIDSIGLSIYTPFPGSALWTYAVKNDKVQYPLDYSRFTFDDVIIPLNNMSVSEIHKYRTRIIIKSYLQPHRFAKLIYHGMKPHNINRIFFLLKTAFVNIFLNNNTRISQKTG